MDSILNNEKEINWFNHWMSHARLIATRSICPRNQVGAFIIDENNNPVSAGFNGPPRKSDGRLCAGEHCHRNILEVRSGTRSEIGCHHAEMNAIANAAKKGISLNLCSIVVSVLPCLACAKMIHHVGIRRVIVSKATLYSNAGLTYLNDNNIIIIFVD